MSLLDVLLSDQPESDRPEKPWLWERKNVEIPCQGLFVNELRDVQKKATRTEFNPKTHVREEHMDQEVFNDELIMACTPTASWTSEEVRQHYGVALAREVIRKAVRRPDDYASLLMHCMELCGLSDGVPSMEEQVKNG